MKTNSFLIHVMFLILTVTGLVAQAQDITVVDVRRNITLAEDDIIYKDYYINAGDGSALKKNLVVNVKRKINVRDAGTKAVGDFEAVVGQLKVIHIGNKVSVAREFKLIPRDEEPMLEQIGIMSGDRVDLGGSFIDNSKPVYKRKTAESEPKKEDSTPVQTAEAAPVVNTQPVVPPLPTAVPEVQSREPAQIIPSAPKAAIPLPQI